MMATEPAMTCDQFKAMNPHLSKLEELKELIDFVEKRKAFLCSPRGEAFYQKVISELIKVIQDNMLNVGEAKDYFALACILNGIAQGRIRDAISWANQEIQSR